MPWHVRLPWRRGRWPRLLQLVQSDQLLRSARGGRGGIGHPIQSHRPHRAHHLAKLLERCRLQPRRSREERMAGAAPDTGVGGARGARKGREDSPMHRRAVGSLSRLGRPVAGSAAELGSQTGAALAGEVIGRMHRGAHGCSRVGRVVGEQSRLDARAPVQAEDGRDRAALGQPASLSRRIALARSPGVGQHQQRGGAPGAVSFAGGERSEERRERAGVRLPVDQHKHHRRRLQGCSKRGWAARFGPGEGSSRGQSGPPDAVSQSNGRGAAGRVVRVREPVVGVAPCLGLPGRHRHHKRVDPQVLAQHVRQVEVLASGERERSLAPELPQPAGLAEPHGAEVVHLEQPVDCDIVRQVGYVQSARVIHSRPVRPKRETGLRRRQKPADGSEQRAAGVRRSEARDVQERLDVPPARDHVVVDDVEVRRRGKHGHLEPAVVFEIVPGAQQHDARVIVRGHGGPRSLEEGRRTKYAHPDMGRRRGLSEQRVELAAERVAVPDVQDGRHGCWLVRAVLAHVESRLGGQQLAQRRLSCLDAALERALARKTTSTWHHLLLRKRLGLCAGLIAQPRARIRLNQHHGGQGDNQQHRTSKHEKAGGLWPHLMPGHHPPVSAAPLPHARWARLLFT
eukprot:scaffold16802_cov121-Isochrysis_galbana.AAC.1